jgi:CRP-like cAMP-binding protein
MDMNSRQQGSSFRNEILAALSVEDIEFLRPHLTRVSLILRQVLHERGSRIDDVFFIEEGVASLTADTVDEGHVEVGLTGREGLVGSSVLLNPNATSIHQAFIQVDGSAYRLSAEALREAAQRSDTLRDRCLRYVEMLMVQTSQSAACNARHSLPERLARWLLTVRDRLDTDALPMTQEFLAVMLGVRRAGVSLAASTLQAAGLIRQSRGSITILDHTGLSSASCDCYEIIQRSRAQILMR